ncbi:hypothetical protein ACWF9G_22980 [Nocardia sp. NPDC055029]
MEFAAAATLSLLRGDAAKQRAQGDERGASSRMTAMGFRPDLRWEDLHTLVARVRDGMPASLWSVVEPWAQQPRRWVGGPGPQGWSGEVYGIDVPAERAHGPWVCELHAPVPWHEVIGELDGVSLAYPRPTMTELEHVWTKLGQLAGVRPAVNTHLGPAPNTNEWIVEITGISASGAAVDESVVEELAADLPGHVGLWTRNPAWLYWDCAATTGST